jgi:hypothetical protein
MDFPIPRGALMFLGVWLAVWLIGRSLDGDGMDAITPHSGDAEMRNSATGEGTEDSERTEEIMSLTEEIMSLTEKTTFTPPNKSHNILYTFMHQNLQAILLLLIVFQAFLLLLSLPEIQNVINPWWAREGQPRVTWLWQTCVGWMPPAPEWKLLHDVVGCV